MRSSAPGQTQLLSRGTWKRPGALFGARRRRALGPEIGLRGLVRHGAISQGGQIVLRHSEISRAVFFSTKVFRGIDSLGCPPDLYVTSPPRSTDSVGSREERSVSPQARLLFLFPVAGTMRRLLLLILMITIHISVATITTIMITIIII